MSLQQKADIQQFSKRFPLFLSLLISSIKFDQSSTHFYCSRCRFRPMFGSSISVSSRTRPTFKFIVCLDSRSICNECNFRYRTSCCFFACSRIILTSVIGDSFVCNSTKESPNVCVCMRLRLCRVRVCTYVVYVRVFTCVCLLWGCRHNHIFLS